MKTILFVLFLLISGWLRAQLQSDTVLSRYCRNDVFLEKKFFIDQDDNPDFEIRYILTDKRRHRQVYQVKPLSLENKINLILRSGRKSVKTIVTLTIQEPPIRVFQHYPVIENRFDFSLGLDNITFKLYLSNPCTPISYISNCFELFREGKPISDKQEMNRYLTEQRPDSVWITHIGFKNDQLQIRSNDTLTVHLRYPSEKDPEKWCKTGQIDTMLFSGRTFEEKDSQTIEITSNPCLYLRFDDDGTENDILIEALPDGKRIWVREFCCGGPIPLLNSTYLNAGLYRVTMRGDGNHPGMLYLRVK